MLLRISARDPCRYLADLLIGHFQDLAASELLSHHMSPASSSLADAPVSNGNASLGPPLQADNWGVGHEACLLDPELVRHIIRPVKVRLHHAHLNHAHIQAKVVLPLMLCHVLHFFVVLCWQQYKHLTLH